MNSIGERLSWRPEARSVVSNDEMTGVQAREHKHAGEADQTWQAQVD